MKKKIKPIKKEMRKTRKSPRVLIVAALISVIIGAVFYLFSKNLVNAIIAAAASAILLGAYNLVNKNLKKLERIKRMEEIFPDFIELVASNLRAGITIDKSLLYSSRKEFAPLDEEILILGKEILTGKEINLALNEMSKRIGSEKIQKTINIITTGINSGGNLSVLLEETAANMREKLFVEKRAASNVLMYVIFIFFAIAVGAPLLFALSTTLMEILTKILANIPAMENKMAIPFSLSKISISVNFVVYFAIIFMITIDILAAFILGLVNKGREKAGTRYIIPLIIVSLAVFFIARLVLGKYLSTFFSS